MVACRQATAEDVPALVLLAHEMWAESQEHKIAAFDPDIAEEYIRDFLYEPNTGWVTVRKGIITGFLLASSGTYMFSREATCAEELFYVAKSFRGSSSALRLVHAYLEWAQSLGALTCNMGCMTGINEARTIRFYQKLGFRHLGTKMRLDLRDE